MDVHRILDNHFQTPVTHSRLSRGKPILEIETTKVVRDTCVDTRIASADTNTGPQSYNDGPKP